MIEESFLDRGLGPYERAARMRRAGNAAGAARLLAALNLPPPLGTIGTGWPEDADERQEAALGQERAVSALLDATEASGLYEWELDR